MVPLEYTICYGISQNTSEKEREELVSWTNTFFQEYYRTQFLHLQSLTTTHGNYRSNCIDFTSKAVFDAATSFEIPLSSKLIQLLVVALQSSLYLQQLQKELPEGNAFRESTYATLGTAEQGITSSPDGDLVNNREGGDGGRHSTMLITLAGPMLLFMVGCCFICRRRNRRVEPTFREMQDGDEVSSLVTESVDESLYTRSSTMGESRKENRTGNLLTHYEEEDENDADAGYSSSFVSSRPKEECNNLNNNNTNRIHRIFRDDDLDDSSEPEFYDDESSGSLHLGEQDIPTDSTSAVSMEQRETVVVGERSCPIDPVFQATTVDDEVKRTSWSSRIQSRINICRASESNHARPLSSVPNSGSQQVQNTKAELQQERIEAFKSLVPSSGATIVLPPKGSDPQQTNVNTEPSPPSGHSASLATPPTEDPWNQRTSKPNLRSSDDECWDRDIPESVRNHGRSMIGSSEVDDDGSRNSHGAQESVATNKINSADSAIGTEREESLDDTPEYIWEGPMETGTSTNSTSHHSTGNCSGITSESHGTVEAPEPHIYSERIETQSVKIDSSDSDSTNLNNLGYEPEATPSCPKETTSIASSPDGMSHETIPEETERPRPDNYLGRNTVPRSFNHEAESHGDTDFVGELSTLDRSSALGSVVRDGVSSEEFKETVDAAENETHEVEGRPILKSSFKPKDEVVPSTIPPNQQERKVLEQAESPEILDSDQRPTSPKDSLDTMKDQEELRSTGEDSPGDFDGKREEEEELAQVSVRDRIKKLNSRR